MSYLIRRKDASDLFDQAFGDFLKPSFWGAESNVMKTDITESESGYKLEIEMPGFKKEEIEVTLNDGYLTVGAEKKEEETQGSYLRRERATRASRSYYVGEIDEDRIKAKYDDGILTLEIPKEEPKKPERKKIEIG